MNIFRLAYQDDETRKIWIRQSREHGCLKNLSPNQFKDFEGAVQKQAAYNIQRRQEAKRAQEAGDTNFRTPAFRTPYQRPAPGSFFGNRQDARQETPRQD